MVSQKDTVSALGFGNEGKQTELAREFKTRADAETKEKRPEATRGPRETRGTGSSTHRSSRRKRQTQVCELKAGILCCGFIASKPLTSCSSDKESLRMVVC